MEIEMCKCTVFQSHLDTNPLYALVHRWIEVATVTMPKPFKFFFSVLMGLACAGVAQPVFAQASTSTATPTA